MLNIIGKKRKKVYWKYINLLMSKLEIQYVKQIASIIKKQYYLAADLLDPDIIEIETATLKNKLKKHYLKTAIIFKDEVINNQKQFITFEKKAFEEEFINKINLYINLHLAEQITKINKTTKNIIKKIIKKGREINLTNREIAKKIQNVGSLSPVRAARIARTETHSMANHSVQTTMETIDIEMEKEWLSSGDARTRVPHNSANGQRVKLEDYFIVDGESLMYPGDMEGSARNTVNCRCISLHHTIKNK